MAECTAAERALIEVAIKTVCEYDRPLDAQSLQCQAFGGPSVPEALVQAVNAVALERIKPEDKARLREIFTAERELGRERGAISSGVPPRVWSALVKETYPKEKADV